MCGKYHVSMEDENVEFRSIIQQALIASPGAFQTGDIAPSLPVPVLTASGATAMRFGLRLSGIKRLLINARSETAAQSPLFSGMIASSRCIVPAQYFFEWTTDKQPHVFRDSSGAPLFMAGLFMAQEQENRFVILTGNADSTVAAVHPRMPVLLGSREYRDAWLRSSQLAINLLSLPPEITLEGMRYTEKTK